MRGGRWLIHAVPFALLAGLVALFWVGLQKDPGHVPSPLIGKPAPSFSLPSLRDPRNTVGTGDLKGRVSLLNVWATWCAGCRQEHGTLVRFSRRYDVPIYGLNWKDQRGKAIEWLDRLGDPYTASAFDQSGNVAIDWGVYGAPETFVVDAEGIVRYKHAGPIDERILQEEILPLIERLEEGTR